MAAPTALNSPYGNGPQDLPPPDAQLPTDFGAPPAASPAPAPAASASAPAPSPAQPSAQPLPQPESSVDVALPEDFLPNDFSPPNDVQGPPEPTAASLGKLGYFRGADGKLLFKEPGGTFREPDKYQREQAGKLADVIETAPELALSALGALGGGALGGVAGRVAGGGAGMVAGGEAADRSSLVQALREVQKGAPPAPTSQAKRVLRGTVGAGGELVGAAAKSLAARDAAKRATSVLEDQFALIKEKIGPKLDEEAAKNFSVKHILEAMDKKLSTEVGEALADLAPHVRQRQFDATPLLADADAVAAKYSGGTPASLRQEIRKLRNRTSPQAGGFAAESRFSPEKPGDPYADLGAVVSEKKTPAAAQGMQPTAAGQGSRGLTFDELENLRKTAKANANFDAINRTAQDKAWGEFYGATTRQRNAIVDQMAAEAGDENLKLRLQNANKAYTESIDTIGQALRKLKEDPTNSVKFLVKKENPEFVKNLYSVLDEPTKKNLSRQFVDSLAEDELGNTISGAAQVRENLKKYDAKTLDIVLGGQRKEFETAANLASALEKISPKSTLFGEYTRKLAHVLFRPEHAAIRESGAVVDKLLENVGKARQDILEKLYAKYPADMQKSLGPIESALGKTPATSPTAAKAATDATIGVMQNAAEGGRSPQSEKSGSAKTKQGSAKGGEDMSDLTPKQRAEVERRLKLYEIQRIQMQEEVRKEREQREIQNR